MYSANKTFQASTKDEFRYDISQQGNQAMTYIGYFYKGHWFITFDENSRTMTPAELRELADFVEQLKNN